MGRTTRYLIALAAWIFAGFLILPVGQGTLIAGADSKSRVALLVGEAIILMWMAGAWFGCYNLDATSCSVGDHRKYQVRGLR
jgi:hypothetical protein